VRELGDALELDEVLFALLGKLDVLEEHGASYQK
jgi:hypothetical protein